MRLSAVLLLCPFVAAAQSLSGGGPLSWPPVQSHAPSAAYVNGITYVFDEDTQGRLRVCENGGNCRIVDTPAAGSSYAGTVTRAIGFNDVVHVFYIERLADGRERLRHAWQPQAFSLTYNIEVLDGLGGFGGRTKHSVGGRPGAVVFASKLYVSYFDSNTADLRLAVFGSSGWSFQTLDGVRGAAGRLDCQAGWSSSFALVGAELMLFYDSDAGLRRALTTDGVNWSFETVPSSVSMNIFTDVKAVASGTGVQVFFPILTGPVIRWNLAGTRGFYSRKGLWTWSTSIIDFSASVGFDVEGASYNGVIHLFYYDISGGNLRHAWGNGTSWTFENVDGHTDDGWTWGRVDADVGRHPALAAGFPTPWVIYEDVTSGILRHAL